MRLPAVASRRPPAGPLPTVGRPGRRILVLLAALLSASVPTRAEPPPGAPNTSVLLSYEDFYAVETPAPGRALVVGSWGRLLRTEDSGRTWTIGSEHAPLALLDVAFADPTHGWIVGEKGLVLHSADGGESWQEQRAGNGYHLFAVAALDPQTAFAVGERGTVLRTRDGGMSWEDLSLGEDVILNDIAFVSPTQGWIVGEFGTILRTLDGGQSWQPRDSIEGAPRDVYLYSAFFTPEYGAAVGLAGTLLWSEDGGVHWRALPTRTRLHLYGVHGSNGRVIAVGDRAVIRRVEGGRVLPPEHVPETAGWLRDVSFRGSEGFAVGAKANVLRSADGGRRWVDVSPRQGSLSEPRREREE